MGELGGEKKGASWAFLGYNGSRGSAARDSKTHWLRGRGGVVTEGSGAPKLGIKTRWRLRAWWLSTFRGYNIESVRRVPKVASFGQIAYNSIWVLKPKPVEKEDT